MDKLELEHLAPYLPYKLRLMHGGLDGENKVMNMGEGSSVNWVGIKSVLRWQDREKLRAYPILRPMKDLKLPEFKMDSWRKEAINFLIETSKLPYNSRLIHINGIMYGDIIRLFEWHFDVFGMIEKGLAIDINTLK